MAYRSPGPVPRSGPIAYFSSLRKLAPRTPGKSMRTVMRQHLGAGFRHALPFLLLIFAPALPAVQNIEFSQLQDPRAPSLTYGEAINIFSEASKTRIQGVPVTDWIDLKNVRLEYRLAGENPNQRQARVADDGFWAVDIAPLPASSQVQLNWRFEGTISATRAARLIDEILTDAEFAKALEAVLKVDDLRTAAQAREDLGQFAGAIEKIINARLPAWISPIQGQSALVNSGAVEQSLATHFGSITGRLNKLRGMFDSLDLTSFSRARQTLGDFRADSPGKQKLVDQFVENYDQLFQAFQAQVAANLEMRAPLEQSAAVSDLLRFAGIDIAATYAPDLDEFLQFVTVNVYFGPVDDKPPAQLSAFGQRLSLTVGFGSDAISKNDTSKIRGDDAYMLGLGWRINKYFRASVGGLIYRNNNNDLDTDEYLSLSIDLTAFDQLSSLVSK